MKLLKVVIIIIVGLVLFVAGVILDGRGFIGNLLAGALDVLVTVTIIDWLLQRQRRRQWKRVRAQIISALTQHIANIASEYMTHFYGPGLHLLDFAEDIGAGYHKANSQTVAALQSMIRNMEEAPRPDEWKEQAEKLHSVIKWDITQIRDSLLPRILAIECDEPELASVLGELDNADRRWVNEIILDREVCAGDQYSAAIDTLKAATLVYRYLVDHGVKS